MPLVECGPSRACGDDVLLPAGGSQAGGRDERVQAELTRRAALDMMAFLVEPPRGLAWRLLEQVQWRFSCRAVACLSAGYHS